VDEKQTLDIIQQLGTSHQMMVIQTTPLRLYVLLSLMQLAMTHPGLSSFDALEPMAREMYENLKTALVCEHPYSQPLIAAGEDRSNDIQWMPKENSTVTFSIEKAGVAQTLHLLANKALVDLVADKFPDTPVENLLTEIYAGTATALTTLDDDQLSHILDEHRQIVARALDSLTQASPFFSQTP
jgi:hypothetical protein